MYDSEDEININIETGRAGTGGRNKQTSRKETIDTENERGREHAGDGEIEKEGKRKGVREGEEERGGGAEIATRGMERETYHYFADPEWRVTKPQE